MDKLDFDNSCECCFEKVGKENLTNVIVGGMRNDENRCQECLKFGEGIHWFYPNEKNEYTLDIKKMTTEDFNVLIEGIIKTNA